MAIKRLVSLCVLFVAFAACAERPTPRGSAYQGAPASGDRRGLDAPYYTGADPAFRPRGGGSN